ncbi:MAG: hypothetical protein JKY27_04845 [Magnetovibrio sp.]|nr:hypothetical protein [Magnetovibrio sp.]
MARRVTSAALAKKIDPTISRFFEEELIKLRKDITSLGRGDVMACQSCHLDDGCCADIGCCKDKGCCGQAKSDSGLFENPDIWLSELDKRITKIVPGYKP